jgi:hypothetical protein
MLRNWMLVALAVGCVFVANGVAAFAQEEGSVLVEPQAAPLTEGPIIAAPAQPVGDEPIPVPTVAHQSVGQVKPAPPVESHASLRARRLYRHHAKIDLVMVTKNPADCCLYEIPLCVPACCVGEPTVSEGRGLLGRGVVEYCWPCGFTATVKFRPVHGDVKIRYDG